MAETTNTDAELSAYLRTRNRETSGRECWSGRGRVEIYEKRSSIGSGGVKRKSLLLARCRGEGTGFERGVGRKASV